MVNENGTMTITRCTISNNSATGGGTPNTPIGPEGGGILNASGGSLVITNSTISGIHVFSIPAASLQAVPTAVALGTMGL